MNPANPKPFPWQKSMTCPVFLFPNSRTKATVALYRSDFQYDVRMLTQAAQEKDMKDRVFYWMSRPNGTWCVKEREVFLQGSGAHSIWTYYADQPEGIRAYRVTITGMEGKKVMGILVPAGTR